MCSADAVYLDDLHMTNAGFMNLAQKAFVGLIRPARKAGRLVILSPDRLRITKSRVTTPPTAWQKVTALAIIHPEQA